MDRSPSAREYGGQAASDYIGCGPRPENDGNPRQDVQSRQKFSDVTLVSGEGGTLQVAKQREEEEQYQHDGNAGVGSLELPSNI